MAVMIDKPLLLPYLKEIKEEIISRAKNAQKIVCREAGIDAGGLQLLLALKKEFSYLEVELVWEGAGSLFYSVWEGEVKGNVPDYSS